MGACAHRTPRPCPCLTKTSRHRTLIDSTQGNIKAWQVFAREYGLNAAQVAHAAHGRRLHDTLKEYCLITDEQQLEVGPFAADLRRCPDNHAAG